MEYVDKIDIQLNGYAKKLHEEQKKREAEHAKKRAAREELANAQVLMSQRVDHLIRQTHQYMKVEVKKINNKEDAEKLRKRIGSGVKWSDAYEKKMLEHGAGVSSSVWKDLYKKRKDEIVDRYKKECNEVWEDLDQNIELQIENAKEAAKVIAAAEKEHEERKQKEREEEKKALEVEAVLAEIDDKGPIDESIRVKKKINILNMSGAVALVNFWYTDDPNAEKENWDRRTFAQCKRYCEKRRNQDDKIFEHEGFEWVDEVSAK